MSQALRIAIDDQAWFPGAMKCDTSGSDLRLYQTSTQVQNSGYIRRFDLPVARTYVLAKPGDEKRNAFDSQAEPFDGLTGSGRDLLCTGCALNCDQVSAYDREGVVQ